MKRLVATTTLLLMIPIFASAQGEAHPYRGQGYGFFALGTGLNDSHPLVEQLGFGGEGFLYKGLGFGGEAVWSHYSFLGYDRPAWIGSVDGSYHFRRHAPRGGIDPFLVGGPSIYSPTSPGEYVVLPPNGAIVAIGGNFGGGVNFWFTNHAALRLEFRQHLNGSPYLPGNVAFAFRVGVTFR
jgi:hypothetical protein